MSRLTGWLTPETHATVEAVLGKLATSGTCNPEDDAPVVYGPAGDAKARRDGRTAAQRNHDALDATLRAVLASGKLGQHNGLPATIIVTTTLRDLEAADGTACTAGGTRLPLSDVIRLARHAHHYLAIFERQRRGALSRRPVGFARAANCAVRHGSWVYPSRLRRAGLLVRGAPRRRLGQDAPTDGLTFACGTTTNSSTPAGSRGSVGTVSPNDSAAAPRPRAAAGEHLTITWTSCWPATKTGRRELVGNVRRGPDGVA